ncbi:MAG: hypothetical protein U1F83_02155 [Verrucomicrobiota bacterium]
MKPNQNQKLIRGLAAVVGGFALFTGTVQAAPFLYSPGDLILTFRKTGGASDLVVNLGKATNYNNLPAGTSFAVSNLLVSHLNTAFAGVNDLAWAVAAANRPPGDPNYALQTLWVTAPRAEAGTPASPWLRKGAFTQGSAAAQIDAAGANPAVYSGLTTSNANNTATAVIIPAGNDNALSPIIGAGGDYDGAFQGNAQNVTASDFDADSANVTRSDLYELIPGTTASGTYNAPGRYLGYFEFKPDGTLTFNVPTSAPPRPIITNITRAGNITTVSFTTVSGATYRLRATDAAGLATPVSTWSIGSSVAGNGAVRSLTDTSAEGIRFFVVDVQ